MASDDTGKNRVQAARQSQVFGFDEAPPIGRARRAIRLCLFILAFVGLAFAAALPFVT
ncbi:hypothetical protein LCM17_13080 [Cereibacter sphaeroides]|nr:hypothetical protein [Cereibacter sphaeroides]